MWLLLNLVLVLTVKLRLGRGPALFLSLYHFINLLQQIKPVVRKLSREQHLSRPPLILNPYLFLCCKEPHVLLIKHGRVAAWVDQSAYTKLLRIRGRSGELPRIVWRNDSSGTSVFRKYSSTCGFDVTNSARYWHASLERAHQALPESFEVFPVVPLGQTQLGKCPRSEATDRHIRRVRQSVDFRERVAWRRHFDQVHEFPATVLFQEALNVPTAP
jgi:hypothetical protein